MNTTAEWKPELEKRLKLIYGSETSSKWFDIFVSFIEPNLKPEKVDEILWDQRDVALIVYGDSIKNDHELPLRTLMKFAKSELNGYINIIHILPFFPYSSDDGFSVIDFEAVDSGLGTWSDIEALSHDFKLMTDLVINHASSQGKWFQNYLKGKGEGCNYFIEENPKTDLTKVVRPRSLPLLTAYKTSRGKKYVWTTFSADQVDLNFRNPEILLKLLKILHRYIGHGAKIIRLDAIAFLWKEAGTSCLHLEQTHEVVKLLRNFVDWIAPGVIILTETNVPNIENLSYFGNGDEAHMVYQFSLPPLLLHALYSANSYYLNNWVAVLPHLGQYCTFFNFTSSHDGIGVRPLEGLLPDEEKNSLFDDIKKSGGLITMKQNPDGTESPYELNITYFDALKRTREGEDTWHEKRFICSQAIMLAMKGIPAFYIHSLLASGNYYEGVKTTGRARTINREKLDFAQLKHELAGDTQRGRVFGRLKKLIEIRRSNRAFHPSAKQRVIAIDKKTFAIERSLNTDETIICIHNISKYSNNIRLDNSLEKFNFDIISKMPVDVGHLNLEPYETCWIIKKKQV